MHCLRILGALFKDYRCIFKDIGAICKDYKCIFKDYRYIFKDYRCIFKDYRCICNVHLGYLTTGMYGLRSTVRTVGIFNTLYVFFSGFGVHL